MANITLKEMQNLIKKCTLCPLHKKCTFGPRLGVGSAHPKVMIIYSVPDNHISTYDAQNKMFYDYWFKKKEINTKNIYITSAIKCGPSVVGANMKTCFGWIKAECEILKPEAIFVMGKVNKFIAEGLIKMGYLVMYNEMSSHNMIMAGAKDEVKVDNLFTMIKKYANVEENQGEKI